LITQQRTQEYSKEPGMGGDAIQVTHVNAKLPAELMEKLEITASKEEESQANI
jgi:hypothetical protein